MNVSFYTIIEDEHGGSYDVDDYEIVESFVAAPIVTLEASTSFVAILLELSNCNLSVVGFPLESWEFPCPSFSPEVMAPKRHQ